MVRLDPLRDGEREAAVPAFEHAGDDDRDQPYTEAERRDDPLLDEGFVTPDDAAGTKLGEVPTLGGGAACKLSLRWCALQDSNLRPTDS